MKLFTMLRICLCRVWLAIFHRPRHVCTCGTLYRGCDPYYCWFERNLEKRYALRAEYLKLQGEVEDDDQDS